MLQIINSKVAVIVEVDPHIMGYRAFIEIAIVNGVFILDDFEGVLDDMRDRYKLVGVGVLIVFFLHKTFR